MKTTKFLCIFLAMLMLVGSCFGVGAAEITEQTSGTTKVTYGMSEGFLVTIPTDFTIDDSAKAEAIVSASNVMISHGSTLEVAISGNDYVDKWELINVAAAADKLAYIIGTSEGASDIINNSVVLSVEAGQAPSSTVERTMYFTVVDEITNAGTYRDTLTFNVSVIGGSSDLWGDDIQGDGEVFDPSNPEPLTFRSEQPITEFQEVLLNGEVVDDDNYTVTEGSTIVTFKEEFLATLSSGDYEVSFVFTNVTITATFKVKAEVIAFYVGDKEYEAEANMTWSTWVNSEYNIDGFIKSPYNEIGNSDLYCIIDSEPYLMVSSSDTIKANGVYVLADFYVGGIALITIDGVEYHVPGGPLGQIVSDGHIPGYYTEGYWIRNSSTHQYVDSAIHLITSGSMSFTTKSFGSATESMFSVGPHNMWDTENQFMFENNMTWADYIASDYDRADEFYLNGKGNVMMRVDGVDYALYYDYNSTKEFRIKGSDTINKSGYYTYSEETAATTFYIDGKEYEVNANMTWGDWVASSYNTDGFVIDPLSTGWAYAIGNKEYYAVLNSSGMEVSIGDFITAGESYQISEYLMAGVGLVEIDGVEYWGPSGSIGDFVSNGYAPGYYVEGYWIRNSSNYKYVCDVITLLGGVKYSFTTSDFGDSTNSIFTVDDWDYDDKYVFTKNMTWAEYIASGDDRANEFYINEAGNVMTSTGSALYEEYNSGIKEFRVKGTDTIINGGYYATGIETAE